MKIELVFPFPPYLWPVAWSWLAPVRQIVCDDYSPKTIDAYVELGIRSNSQAVGISDDGRLVGVITFEPVNQSTVLMHMLFAPKFGVMKMGIAARMACGKAFEGGIRKVMALIPAPNKFAIALAVRSGAKIEGVLRSHSLRDGKPLDAVAVGITKEEFEHGIEFRRSDRRSIEQHQVVEPIDEHADVLGGADGRPIPAGPAILQCSTSNAGGHDLGAGAGSRDGQRSADRLDQLGDGHSDEPVPRKSRIRSERTNRASRPTDGAGKTKRAGSKRVKRGGTPAKSK